MPTGSLSAAPAHRDVLEVGDDVGVIFDVGHGDEELAEIRLRHPLFTIEHTRDGWFAQPVWTTDPDTYLRAPTSSELSEQMTQAAGEYRLSLMTRGQDGWHATP